MGRHTPRHNAAHHNMFCSGGVELGFKAVKVPGRNTVQQTGCANCAPSHLNSQLTPSSVTH